MYVGGAHTQERKEVWDLRCLLGFCGFGVVPRVVGGLWVCGVGGCVVVVVLWFVLVVCGVVWGFVVGGLGLGLCSPRPVVVP